MVCPAKYGPPGRGVPPKTGVKQVIVNKSATSRRRQRFIVTSWSSTPRRWCSAYSLPQATKLTDALARGAGKSFQVAAPQADDVAVLGKYTGGAHRRLRWRLRRPTATCGQQLQCKALMGANLNEGQEILIRAAARRTTSMPLPPLHGDDVTGNYNILITNPRDLLSMPA